MLKWYSEYLATSMAYLSTNQNKQESDLEGLHIAWH